MQHRFVRRPARIVLTGRGRSCRRAVCGLMRLAGGVRPRSSMRPGGISGTRPPIAMMPGSRRRPLAETGCGRGSRCRTLPATSRRPDRRSPRAGCPGGFMASHAPSVSSRRSSGPRTPASTAWSYASRIQRYVASVVMSGDRAILWSISMLPRSSARGSRPPPGRAGVPDPAGGRPSAGRGLARAAAGRAWYGIARAAEDDPPAGDTGGVPPPDDVAAAARPSSGHVTTAAGHL